MNNPAIRPAERRADVEIRYAWLQKHPTPVAADGEFHWFPREGDRDLRAELVERIRGLDPSAVFWELSPGRVVWARGFAAHAPTDGRRYVGLAVTIAEATGVSAADLLASIAVADAEPWSEQTAINDAIVATSWRGRHQPARSFDRLDAIAVDAPLSPVAHQDTVAIARTLISGGVARIAAGDGLTALLAALESQLPAAIAQRRRQGACVIENRASVENPALRDVVAELAVSAWCDPAQAQAQAWRLLGELAATRDETLDEVMSATEMSVAVLGDEERAALQSRAVERTAIVVRWPADSTSRIRVTPDVVEITDVLHAWGRGWFDLCPTAGSIVPRLADAVALQVLVELASGRDGQASIAAARWHAVLPAARRVRLFETLIERAATLRALVEVSDG